MGDIKLAMVIGFAAGFPYALVAILAMALSMGLFSIIGMLLKKLNAKSKLPFAAFLMFGAIVAKLLVLNS
jgi:leader peptidase (prepilin peptidase)/N-methyltransferase